MADFGRRALLGVMVAFAARPSQAADAAVSIDNFTFAPQILKVAVGTRVVWTNHDDIPHTVMSAAQPPLFRSPHALDTDDGFARVFDQAGSFGYFCSLHPHMTGTIVVG